MLTTNIFPVAQSTVRAFLISSSVSINKFAVYSASKSSAAWSFNLVWLLSTRSFYYSVSYLSVLAYSASLSIRSTYLVISSTKDASSTSSCLCYASHAAVFSFTFRSVSVLWKSILAISVCLNAWWADSSSWISSLVSALYLSISDSSLAS